MLHGEGFGQGFRRDELRKRRGVFLQKVLGDLTSGRARKSGRCLFCEKDSGPYRSRFPTCRNDAALCRDCRRSMDFLASFVGGLLRSPAITRVNGKRFNRFHLLLRAMRSLAASMPTVFKEPADSLSEVDIFGDVQTNNQIIEAVTLQTGCPDLAYEIDRISGLGL